MSGDGVLLVVHKPGKELRVMQDVKDATFVIDQNVRTVIGWEKGGIIFVYTSKPESVYRRLVSVPLQHVSRIIKFDAFSEDVESVEDILKLVDEAIKKAGVKGGTFAVRCRLRGWSIGDHEVEIKVGEYIVKKYGLKVNLRNPDIEVVIEGALSKVGVAIVKKRD